jgi:hypothetical protein
MTAHLERKHEITKATVADEWKKVREAHNEQAKKQSRLSGPMSDAQMTKQHRRAAAMCARDLRFVVLFHWFLSNMSRTVF